MKNQSLTIEQILILFRPDTEKTVQMAQELNTWLKEKGLKTFSHPQQKLNKCPSLKNLKDIDLIITLGGDGTYLEAVRLLNGQKTPILGVNMGSLGFLTVTPESNLFSMVEKTLQSELEMRPRSMLEAVIESPQGEQHFTALNDIVLERGAQSQLLYLKIYSESHLVSDLKADGLIFSSPTGSTAYNLAAGGPILHPEVAAFAMTPICPHSLTNRPTIFPDTKNVRIELPGPQQTATLTIDGKKQKELSQHDVIHIHKAKCSHYVLRPPTHNYFDLLREKLKFGQRA